MASCLALDRFKECRCQKVQDMVLRPSKKVRHEKVNVELLVRKSEQQYVDFQQAGARGATVFYLYPHEAHMAHAYHVCWILVSKVSNSFILYQHRHR